MFLYYSLLYMVRIDLILVEFQFANGFTQDYLPDANNERLPGSFSRAY